MIAKTDEGVYTICCDYCMDELQADGFGKVQTLAKDEGWRTVRATVKYEPVEHYCPLCWEEVKND